MLALHDAGRSNKWLWGCLEELVTQKRTFVCQDNMGAIQ